MATARAMIPETTRLLEFVGLLELLEFFGLVEVFEKESMSRIVKMP